MTLPNPDYSYRGADGFTGRMTRLDLESSSLGRERAPEEERAYWQATLAELESEFPWDTAGIENARRRLADLTSDIEA